MNWEYYSNVALVTSVVVYLLAMMAHAAEWASARDVAGTRAESSSPRSALLRSLSPSTSSEKPLSTGLRALSLSKGRRAFGWSPSAASASP